VEGGKGPGDPLKRQTSLDMGIGRDIRFIVEVDEIMAKHLPEDGKNSHGQRRPYEKLTARDKIHLAYVANIHN
jgi:hypothetical protein